MTDSWLDSSGLLLGSHCPLPLDDPFTADDARRLGVSARQLASLRRDGLVVPVLRGVLAVAQAVQTPQFRAAAVARVSPPAAIVTDRTAAWIWGVDIQPRSAPIRLPPIQCFDRRPGSRSRRDGVASGERRLASYDLAEVNGIMLTSRVRTALDLGRLLWRYDALAALDGFLRVGVSLDELLSQVERFKGYRGVVQLRGLAPLADARAESPAESALRLHWIEEGLPCPELQWWVHDDDGAPLYRLDLALPELLFAAEYDGFEFHQGAAVEHDEERREWLTARGWTQEVFIREDVYGDRPPGFRLRRAIAEARRSLAVRTAMTASWRRPQTSA